ncbi:MAG: 5,6-dimethylbenzimidazole synthase [bacterium ADurb.Bin429]|nr:MAG: 5,6-dimethylbenzimidazole synthase [bacterium ADurb.Bin429]
MNVSEAIATRRSVRAYAARPVERAVIEDLLSAAALAPSAMNTQPWAFGVIQDAARLQAYSDSTKAALLTTITPGSPLERYREMLTDPEYHIFYHAPALVVIYGTPASPCPQNDCSLAAMTLMLAAWEQGLASCWIGFALSVFNDPTIKAELGVPTDYTAVAPLILGYPASETPVPEKNPPAILFWEG